MAVPVPVPQPAPREPPVTMRAPPRPRACDLSTTCFACGAPMRPEHAHYRCPECGWRDSCCDGTF